MQQLQYEINDSEFDNLQLKAKIFFKYKETELSCKRQHNNVLQGIIEDVFLCGLRGNGMGTHKWSINQQKSRKEKLELSNWS